MHKEIKDYRTMKRKLKSIIVQFGDRLEELKRREITRELQETQDKIQYEESLQRAQEFMQNQSLLLKRDPFGRGDSSGAESSDMGEEDSSSFTESMRTMSSFTVKASDK